MPEDIEIEENLLRIVASTVNKTPDELDFEQTLVDDLGFDRASLKNLAFVVNADAYFKPLGVALIPDDVADCETLGEVYSLLDNELNNDNQPTRRRRDR